MHQHSHSLTPGQINKMFYIGIALNLGFTVFEYFAGLYANSLSLISDASHNLSDVFSLFISLLGLKLLSISTGNKRTYGYRKASILASLVNAILILWIVVEILKTIYTRFFVQKPVEMNITWVSLVALVGIAVNFLSAFLFFHSQKKDINIRGAFLHLILDGVVSVGVLVSGVLMYYTGWVVLDLLISLIIVVFIISSTWGLLKESLTLILDGVPKQLNLPEVISQITSVEEVISVHHTHIWALSSNQNALTAHIVLTSITLDQWLKVKEKINQNLLQLNISHTTLQPELSSALCENGDGCGA